MERIAINVSKQHIKNINNEISFKAYANEITVILSNDDRLIHSLIHKMVKPNNAGISYYEHKLDKQREYILNFLGYMPSTLPAFKRMTIEEYFKYSAKFYQGDYTDNINSLINYFNLDKSLTIKSLSYEEKKIINFIDSVFFEPEVLILENPFADISNITIAKMIMAIRQLRDNGFSVILTSLKYDELSISDRIYLLDTNGINEFKQPKKDKLSISFFFDKNEHIDNLLKELDAADIVYSPNSVAFNYEGDINTLLTKLSKTKLSNLKIYPQSIYHLGV